MPIASGIAGSSMFGPATSPPAAVALRCQGNAAVATARASALPSAAAAGASTGAGVSIASGVTDPPTLALAVSAPAVLRHGNTAVSIVRPSPPSFQEARDSKGGADCAPSAAVGVGTLPTAGTVAVRRDQRGATGSAATSVAFRFDPRQTATGANEAWACRWEAPSVPIPDVARARLSRFNSAVEVATADSERCGGSSHAGRGSTSSTGRDRAGVYQTISLCTVSAGDAASLAS